MGSDAAEMVPYLQLSAALLGRRFIEGHPESATYAAADQAVQVAMQSVAEAEAEKRRKEQEKKNKPGALGTIANTAVGGLTGFATGGPAGAALGAGAGLVGSMSPQSAVDPMAFASLMQTPKAKPQELAVVPQYPWENF